MKIAFFELEDWEKEFFKKNLKKHELKFIDSKLTEENAGEVRDFDALGIFIYSEIDEKILGKLDNLKLILTMSTGFDHIDLEECRKRGVVVCNVPRYGANTVAEHTFALILALSRKIYQTINRTRKGDFSNEGLRGFDLKGKVIGVIGTGDIGEQVIRIAKGFEMKVLAYDVKKDEKLAKKYDFDYVSLDKLLKKSDIVTLHCPYNEKTHHLINREKFELMKKNSLIINTARGGLIDTESLLKALNNGEIMGAGLDVLEEECHIKEDKQVMSKHFPKECDLKVILDNHALMKKDNVLITPHNAFNSREALQRILDTTLDNINSFVEGKIKNRVH